MMPEEKLPIEDFGEMEAYLAEGRSIGGLSGSPVFVRNTVKIPMQTAGRKTYRNVRAWRLAPYWGWYTGIGNTPFIHGNSQAEAVNMGVSIIVPAKKILETLYHPELSTLRRKHWDDNRPTH